MMKKKSSKQMVNDEYKETPQGSGFEEDLKVPNQGNLIIDKLKERRKSN